MNARLRCLLSTVVLPVVLPAVLLGVAVSWSVAPLHAQPVVENASAGASDDNALREQDIYIPYEQLRQVFEKHGRGVFLPYEQFQTLWRAAREQSRPDAPPKPPVDAIITEIDNEATVAEDVVRVTARLKIEVLAEGWNEIPLSLNDAAITRATLGDQPARILAAADGGYRLLVEKKGAEPEQIELTLEYAKAIQRTPGLNSVSFQAPQAPVSRWQVRIPQSGVKVNVQPLIAASEVPAGADPAQPDETLVQAFVGAAPTVRIDWTPKAEGATGLEALASVLAEQEVRVGEGVTRTRTRLAYTVSRAELAQLSIEVPADQKVVNVFDPNVRQWSVEKVDNGQRISAQLFQPAKATQQITVELEQFTADRGEGTLPVPAVKALGVDRQQGVLVVQVDEGLRATAEGASGLLQVDASELPQSLRGGKWDFAYRYATAEFALGLQLEKVEPRLQADTLIEATVEPERLTLDLTIIYTVQRAGVFQLEMDVPAGFDVRHVRGRAVAGARAAEVDSHDLTGPDSTRLVVHLARQAAPASREPGGFDGRVALAVRLQRNLPQSSLLTPGGQQDVPLPIPRVGLAPVERADGRLLVYAPESLRVNAGAAEGLRSVSFNEALAGMEQAADRPADVRPVLAFRFVGQPAAEELPALPLSVERRKPQVTVRQLLVMRIDSGVVKYEATFFYDVLYSGIESLWIDVPPEVSARLRNETKTIQEEKVADPPAAYAAQGDAWKFTAESELLGEGQIKLVWEENIEDLGLGKSVELAVPYLKPMGVDRAWGQIVLAKAETIDVEEKELPAALRPIDPQRDLIAPVVGAARAMEFHEDWALSVVATQYKLEEIKRTSLEQSVVRMVATRADQVAVQALYRIRSARQRLQVRLPAGAKFDTEPARINGRPVTLQGGDVADTYLVPLVSSADNEPFVLELRYTIAGGPGQLDLPVFPEEPAVQKVYLCAYLPEDWALLDVWGPWTEEYGWGLDSSLRFRPVPRRDVGATQSQASTLPATVAGLIAQVCDGITMTGDVQQGFQTDGRLYVFSTLRPAPPPDGSLGMSVFNATAFSALVFLGVILGGLVLLPAGAARRALAIGALIVALVLCGVFLPIFSMQILSGQLAAALFLVLVVWVVWYFVHTRPRAAARQRVARAASPPAQSPSPAPAASSASAEAPTPADSPNITSTLLPPESSEDRPNAEGGEGGRTDV